LRSSLSQEEVHCLHTFSAFSDDYIVPDGGLKAKASVTAIFSNEVFNQPEFQTPKGPLGSHSVRKLGSTHAKRKSGCSKNEKNPRGRCGKGRVSDVYDDVELPFPDAKAAGKLCVGGPCKYITDGSGVTDDFLLQQVVPNICTRFPAEVAKVLARTLPSQESVTR
jgi:hypothetical protein